MPPEENGSPLDSRRVSRYGAENTLTSFQGKPMSLPFLQQGNEGPVVSALQLALAALGFDVGPVDGMFGDATVSAVTQFQESQGVAASGTVDDATWELLGRQ